VWVAARVLEVQEQRALGNEPRARMVGNQCRRAWAEWQTERSLDRAFTMCLPDKFMGAAQFPCLSGVMRDPPCRAIPTDGARSGIECVPK
jgi:hypothetical protein